MERKYLNWAIVTLAVISIVYLSSDIYRKRSESVQATQKPKDVSQVVKGNLAPLPAKKPSPFALAPGQNDSNDEIWLSVTGRGPLEIEPPKPTLKQLLCQLDALACKRKLQYSIDQQFSGYAYWVGFAWPEGMSFNQAASSIEDGGVPHYVAQINYKLLFSTKEEAAEALIFMLSHNEPPNIQPTHADGTPENTPPLEPAIAGPMNCDPHRQCQ